MGLDLVYGVLKDNLNVKIGSNKNISKTDNSISVYYRLNWAGVREESSYILGRYIFSNMEKDTIFENEEYYIVEVKTGFQYKKGKDLTKDSCAILLTRAKDFIENNKEAPASALNLLSLGLWSGGNGEYFEVKREKRLARKILMTKDKTLKIDRSLVFVAYVENQGRSEIKVLNENLKEYKQILRNTLREAEADNDYISENSVTLIKLISYFLEHEDSTLFANFG